MRLSILTICICTTLASSNNKYWNNMQGDGDAVFNMNSDSDSSSDLSDSEYNNVERPVNRYPGGVQAIDITARQEQMLEPSNTGNNRFYTLRRSPRVIDFESYAEYSLSDNDDRKPSNGKLNGQETSIDLEIQKNSVNPINNHRVFSTYEQGLLDDAENDINNTPHHFHYNSNAQ